MPIPLDSMHLIELDGTVFRVSARTLHAIEHAGPEVGRAILLEKGYPVGRPTAFGALAFRSTQPPHSEVAGRQGRPATTGRFDTRAELLDRAWFYQRHTDMSDAAIARNLGISPTALARIFTTREGCPPKEEAARTVEGVSG